MSIEESINNLASAIDNLAGAMGALIQAGGVAEVEVEVPAGKPAAEEKPKRTRQSKAKTEKKPEPEPKAEPEGDKEFTIDDVRAAMLSASREVSRATLTKYGAKKVSELKVEDYEAFIGDLEEMG